LKPTLSTLLCVLGGAYVIQSLISMFALQGIPAILRTDGVSTSQIGLFYLVMLPWALKFLWSPYVENKRKQGQTLKNHTFLIVGSYGLCALLLALLIFVDMSNLALTFSLIAAMALLSTCADIASDGLAIDHLSEKNRGLGNIMQVGGSYIGALIGGGLFLYLVGTNGWLLALVMLVCAVCIMSLPAFTLLSNKFQNLRTLDAPRASLKHAFSNRTVIFGLLFIVISQIGTRLVLSMMMPFLVDQGLDLEQLGLLAAGGGTLTALCAVFISGSVIRYINVRTAFLIVLFLESLCYGALYLSPQFATTLPASIPALYIICSLLSAAKFVVLYTLLMGWSFGPQSGVNFSLFQSADMVVAILCAIIAGSLVSSYGYGTLFLLATLSSFAALLILIFVRKNKG
jgi:MFS transporter (putative signal transducer)